MRVTQGTHSLSHLIIHVLSLHSTVLAEICGPYLFERSKQTFTFVLRTAVILQGPVHTLGRSDDETPLNVIQFASRKRRRKGNLVPGGITGPSCTWGI
jgi:hypothetical protein